MTQETKAAGSSTVGRFVGLRHLVTSKIPDEGRMVMHCVHAHGITDTPRVDAYRKGVMDVLEWAEQSNANLTGKQKPENGGSNV